MSNFSNFYIVIFYFIFFLGNIRECKSQDCPIEDFLKISFNYSRYKIENFQVDTLKSHKSAFFNKLKVIAPEDYNDINGNMSLNESSFPSYFLITDLNKDGNKEYLIEEPYESTIPYFYMYRNNQWINPLKGLLNLTYMVEDADHVWLESNTSYIGWERNYNMALMLSDVYIFSLKTAKYKFCFKLYKAFQAENYVEDIQGETSGLKIPSQKYEAKKFITNQSSRFYVNGSLPAKFRSNGCISKGSLGWIMGDTLNAYFAVFDMHTAYMNDSLGNEKITSDDKGYLLCWIPKTIAYFASPDGINGTYMDNKTNEYLRFFETDKEMNITYFNHKSFEKKLRLETYNKSEMKLVVKFQKSEKIYLLEFQDNFKKVQCTNPDGSKQIFVKI